MNNFTTNTYEMKRDIVKFSKKIETDMIYGISKSKNILLSNIDETLNENTKKAYTIDRLNDNLARDLNLLIDENNCNLVMIV